MKIEFQIYEEVLVGSAGIRDVQGTGEDRGPLPSPPLPNQVCLRPNNNRDNTVSRAAAC